MDLHPGDLIGEYRIDRSLGRGGLGAVYQATHLISQRAEALKVLLPGQTSTAEMSERFRREIQLLASLNHPHIARLHNAFHHGEQLVMVMELVEGEDLLKVARRTSFSLPHLLELATQVLSALDYAHQRGVVHRDLKPANIMLTANGTAKLLDFGIAISEQSADLTVAGALIGSPAYISPEQIRGEKATAQSDIYSLGVTLYQMIAGRGPFVTENTHSLLMAHLQQVPPSLQVLHPDVPPFVAEAIAKALEKEPAQRFSTAMDFLKALRRDRVDDVSVTVVSTPAGSAQDSRVNGTRTVTAPQLEVLTRHLAGFIGPIAKIVVARLANRTSDLDKLYAACARQIDDEAERQKFLRTRPRSGS